MTMKKTFLFSGFHRGLLIESDKNNEDTSITIYLLYHYFGISR